MGGINPATSRQTPAPGSEDALSGEDEDAEYGSVSIPQERSSGRCGWRGIAEADAGHASAVNWVLTAHRTGRVSNPQERFIAVLRMGPE
jgi:hypothetical protein